MGAAPWSRRCCGPGRRATKMLPSRSAASSCVRLRPPLAAASRAAPSRSSAARTSALARRRRRRASRRARCRRRRTTTAASTCEEISVRSASAPAASMKLDANRAPILPAVRRPLAPARREVLRRPGPAPRRDDRLLRAALLRLADLPRARAARLHRPRGGVELPRPGAAERSFPSQSITDIVRVVETITANATTLGVIGGAFLLWTSLSLFSVLESAFNIVYGRPNRSFLRGKALATLFMAGSLVIALRGAAWSGSIGYDLLQALRARLRRQRRSSRTRSRCSSRPWRCSSSSSPPTSG